MLTLNYFATEDGNMPETSAILPETYIDNTGITLWPAAFFLSVLLQEIIGQHSSSILELGAGVGLTARYALSFLPIKKYYAQQYPDQERYLLTNTGEFGSQFQLIIGRWGEKDLINRLQRIPELDCVLLADCFYLKSTFTDLIYTIKCIMNSHESAKIICLHHNRK